MDEEARRHAEQLFQQAADLPPEQRPLFLDTTCNDAVVREEVASLLAHLGDNRIRSLHAVGSMDGEDAELIGESVGPYRLLELIGEGGFGAVYMAEQERPVRRRVAVKIIKLGMNTKQVVARFEAERQAMAMMEHPSIATVYDAGTTERGRPYFAMELVRGVPLTEFCDANRLATRQRLELLVQVCRGVQHAHQKGIIHRDIKPTNVLVTLHDGVPVPKIIDFGIAKAMHQSLTDKTLFTAFRQFVGTPEYVSPEQAEMSGLDIDTRSDIYSLGVLTYELLTGMTPFDPRLFRDATYSEVERIICEQEPITPSRRVSTLGAELGVIADARRTEPHSLRKLLRGDLDWIVMKALEKDRNRRYETAAAMADDIERHLQNEAVSAGPPGVIYRLRKTVARHKTAAGFIVTLFVVVSVFGGWMTLLYAEAERERSAAQSNLLRAQEAEHRAEVEARTAGQVAHVLAGLYEVADPFRERGRASSAREILESAAEKIRNELNLRPETQAALMHTMGCVYTNLGIYDRAESLLRDALELRRANLGEAHPDTIASMNSLGRALMLDNRLPEAEGLLRDALEIARTTLDKDHPEVINANAYLSWALQSGGKYAESEPLCRQSLHACRRVYGDEHPQTVSAINALSWLLQRRQKFEEAEALSREALQTCLTLFGEESVYSAESMNILGVLLLEVHRLTEAEPLIRSAAAIRSRILGPAHPETLESTSNVAWLLARQGRPVEAEREYRAVLEGYRQLHGEEHRRTLKTMCHLSGTLCDQGKYIEAEALVAEALPKLRLLVGEDHQNTLECLLESARVLSTKGEYREAEAVLRDSIDTARTSLGEYSTLALQYSAGLGRVLMRQGKYGESEPFLERAHLGFRHRFGYEDDQSMVQLRLHTDALLAQGKWLEGEALLREASAFMRTTLGDDHISTVRTVARLGVICSRRDELAEADLLLEEAIPGLQRELGEKSDETLHYLDEWLAVLSRRDKPARGEAIVRETLAALRERLGDDDPTTLRWEFRLGNMLVCQNNVAEAEKVLGHASAGLRRELGDQHTDTLDSLSAWFYTLREQGRLGEQEQLIREVLAKLKDTFGAESEQALRLTIVLAEALQQQGRFQEVAGIVRDVLRITRRNVDTVGCRACLIGNPVMLLGECLAAQRRYSEAEPMLLEGFAIIEEVHGSGHKTFSRALRRIADFYEAWGKPAEAEKWRAKLLTEDRQ